MVTLQMARENRKVFVETFEEEKAREFAEKVAAYDAQINSIVWEMHESGKSVSEIAREYGTKSRSTIYEILKRKPVMSLAENVARYTATFDPETEIYTVTDAETGASARFKWPVHNYTPMWQTPRDGYTEEERQIAANAMNVPDSPEREALYAVFLGQNPGGIQPRHVAQTTAVAVDL